MLSRAMPFTTMVMVSIEGIAACASSGGNVSQNHSIVRFSPSRGQVGMRTGQADVSSVSYVLARLGADIDPCFGCPLAPFAAAIDAYLCRGVGELAAHGVLANLVAQ